MNIHSFLVLTSIGLLSLAISLFIRTIMEDKLKDDEIAQLAHVRLEIVKFIEMLDKRNAIHFDRLVFYIMPGWEAEVVNVSRMEDDHGLDEQRISRGE
jgi:hypothetical protein